MGVAPVTREFSPGKPPESQRDENAFTRTIHNYRPIKLLSTLKDSLMGSRFMEYSDDAQLSLRHLSPSSHLAKKCHDAFAITRVDLGSEYSLQISGSSCLNND